MSEEVSASVKSCQQRALILKTHGVIRAPSLRPQISMWFIIHGIRVRVSEGNESHNVECEKKWRAVQVTEKFKKCRSEAGGFEGQHSAQSPEQRAVRCASWLSQCLDAQDADSPPWVTQ